MSGVTSRRCREYVPIGLNATSMPHTLLPVIPDITLTYCKKLICYPELRLFSIDAINRFEIRVESGIIIF